MHFAGCTMHNDDSRNTDDIPYGFMNMSMKTIVGVVYRLRIMELHCTHEERLSAALVNGNSQLAN